MEQTTTRSGDGSQAIDERPLNELVKQLSEQSTRLARMEVELAKAELRQKGKQVGIGAGALGAAGLVAVLALGALTGALILALSEAVAGWLAALIVTLVYAAIAGALALIGRSRVEAGTPPAPEQAIQSSKEDIETAKQSAKEARA